MYGLRASTGQVERVDISLDGGNTWSPAGFLGPCEPYAWRQWQFIWQATEKGEQLIMARAKDTEGRFQPLQADWNVLGYGNNGVFEHSVKVNII
jgi:hypothetical protein